MSEASANPSSRSGNGATNFKQRVIRDGQEQVQSGKRTAADRIDDIAGAIGAAGSKLDQSQPTLANYVGRLADSVGGIAAHLREDSIEDLYHRARRLAMEHPAMFVVGSAVVGLAIARFMKSEGNTRV